MVNNLSKSINNSVKGFTIVELLIVIAVIGILASITVVLYGGIQERSRDIVRASDVDSVLKLLALSKEKHRQYDFYPISGGYDYYDQGGVLSPRHLEEMRKAEFPPELLRNPSAPKIITNSYVFNVYDYSAKRNIFDMPDSGTIQTSVPGPFSMPKTSVYFIEALGDATSSTQTCYLIYSCEGDATGVRVHYYSESDKIWKSKQTGSGTAFKDHYPSLE